MDKTPDRNEGLDFVRGICALCVVVYHMLYWKHGITILSLGTFPVYIFFILSAATMQIAYKERFSNIITKESLQTFYKNRIARIMPLLTAVAFFGFCLSSASLIDFIRMIMTGSGAFSIHMPAYLSNTAGAWSLGIEIFFYIVFPLICLLIASVKIRNLCLVTGIAIIIQQLLMLFLEREFAVGSVEWWRAFIMPAVFAPFFLMGFLTEKIGSKIQLHNTAKILCASGAFIAMSLFSLFFNIDVWESNWVFLGLEILACIVVAMAFSADVPKTLRKIGAFFGNISYALYLTHWYVYSLVTKIVDLKDFTLPVVIVLQIVCASAIYRFFETPMRRMLRSL